MSPFQNVIAHLTCMVITHVHVHIHTFWNVSTIIYKLYKHIYIYKHIFMHTYVCFHTCTYMQTYIYIYACKDYIRKDAHVLSCNIYICIRARIYI